jgi:hypothetical protein
MSSTPDLVAERRTALQSLKYARAKLERLDWELLCLSKRRDDVRQQVRDCEKALKRMCLVSDDAVHDWQALEQAGSFECRCCGLIRRWEMFHYSNQIRDILYGQRGRPATGDRDPGASTSRAVFRPAAF